MKQCDGSAPCAQCLARQRECKFDKSTAAVAQDAPANDGSHGHARTASRENSGSIARRTSATRATHQTTKRVSTHELLSRLIDVEQQIKTVANTVASRKDLDDDQDCEETTEGFQHESPLSTWSDNENDRQTFVGELSMPEAPRDSSQQHLPAAIDKSVTGSVWSLSPKGESFSCGRQRPGLGKQSRNWFKALLRSHGVEPNRSE